MGEGRRIDDDEVDALVAGILNALHQFVLGVALHRHQVVARILRLLLQNLIDIREIAIAIDTRLALSQQIQVWPMQDQDGCHWRNASHSSLRAGLCTDQPGTSREFL